jgi:hypothetical protein
MANLGRAIGRFAQTPILGWDTSSSSWVDTGLKGRLQVFDRFITERDFGQRKRVLTLTGNRKAPLAHSVVRLQGSDTTYMRESAVNDIEGKTIYASVFTLHEAPFRVQVCKLATAVARSGVKLKTGETVLNTTWVNISRYSAVDSKDFANSDYTIYSVYFPIGTPLDTDTYIRRLDNGEVIDINEVFQALELPAARGLRRG